MGKRLDEFTPIPLAFDPAKLGRRLTDREVERLVDEKRLEDLHSAEEWGQMLRRISATFATFAGAAGA